ncbi:MAG: phosphate ABC transporter substrate-binding protein PstS [Nitrososphaerota archaeon]|nr:phosphate ABC transporter substrate-binding protein PstS [Candidatus Nezhaarchaeota archaeon]MDW8050404.1 phosphate ABC transporter substrate-binding protein PstS [Nitrososphaerota archaeon]
MKRVSGILIAVACVVVAVVVLGVAAYQLPTQTMEEKTVAIDGAGATFPFPLIDKWITEYNKIRPKVFINYKPIGSGGGIRAHMEKTVHFAATDVPLTEAQLRNASGTLHIPITIGGVVVIYNVPGVPKGLNFTGEVLAKIFLGEITKWNDPRIVEINPRASLPDKDIVVVRRADASGTTFIWTSYLSAVSKEWRERVGVGTSVNWPVGLGARGNDGVAATVQQTPYSIGYVEFTYAKMNNLTYGNLKNAAGEFIEPSIESFMRAAAAAALTLPRGNESWSEVSIVKSVVNDTKARGVYPITSFSYIIVYRELSALPNMDQDTARALVYFLWWCTHEGQNYAAGLYYVPLPAEVIRHNEETIKMITFNGQRVYRG